MKNRRNFAPEKQNEKAKLWHTIIIITMNMSTSTTATAHANIIMNMSTIIMDMNTIMNMSTTMDMSTITIMRRAA